MSQFRLERFWHVFIEKFGLSANALALEAGLPANIFEQDPALVDVNGWVSLWDAMEAMLQDPNLALHLGESVTLDMFDPALFATLCSENLRQAASRLQRYKRLMGPCRLNIEDGASFTIGCEIDGMPLPPRIWGVAELVMLVKLVRYLTCQNIIPLRVEMPAKTQVSKALPTYFGVALTHGQRYAVTFDLKDAQRPFVTTDASMWQFFEPTLEQRIKDSDANVSMCERVRMALHELLPSGRTELSDVAQALSVSTRTVQRRLGHEGRTFREILEATRAQLAMHYLKHSQLTTAEIAFLIGYDDPNSLYPAFRSWTGATPQAVRDRA